MSVSSEATYRCMPCGRYGHRLEDVWFWRLSGSHHSRWSRCLLGQLNRLLCSSLIHRAPEWSMVYCLLHPWVVAHCRLPCHHLFYRLLSRWRCNSWQRHFFLRVHSISRRIGILSTSSARRDMYTQPSSKCTLGTNRRPDTWSLYMRCSELGTV